MFMLFTIVYTSSSLVLFSMAFHQRLDSYNLKPTFDVLF
jgi:hypothetical protein